MPGVPSQLWATIRQVKKGKSKPKQPPKMSKHNAGRTLASQPWQAYLNAYAEDFPGIWNRKHHDPYAKKLVIPTLTFKKPSILTAHEHSKRGVSGTKGSTFKKEKFVTAFPPFIQFCARGRRHPEDFGNIFQHVPQEPPQGP